MLKVLSECFPNYRSLAIHESSPCGRGASVKLQRECPQYTSSQFYPDIQPGRAHPQQGFRCENLERLTFADNSLDLFVTQDVMEHIFHPGQAFKEIARVLKPGGAHVFTAPLINKAKETERWASVGANGEITYHQAAEYHGNPVDAKGALVTMHWGYDIAGFIWEAARTPTVIFQIDDIDKGIRAEYIDVLVSWKQPPARG